MPEARQGSRRKARRKAFQCLYSLDFARETTFERVTSCFAHFFDEDEAPPQERDFALELVRGVIENIDAIDGIITSYSRHWRLERIAKIELGILRLSIYEMTHREDIPLKVSINEAVELSKSFGDENSRGFINGILDAVAQSVREGKFAIRKDV